MLPIKVKPVESSDIWDDSKQEFVHRKFDGCTLLLEHSLISISKWESKWHVSFLSNKGVSDEQTLSYIKCMTINNVPDDAYDYLTAKDIQDISDYINDPMTATIINDPNGKKNSREIITSELIYYWMLELGIPFECEKWHINRLLQLIALTNVKRTPPKKMSNREVMERNKALNAARRAKYNTKG